MSTVITLTTDFGLKDGNVGVMKGVIWGITPQAQIADVSHLISPQNVAEAALITARSTPYFPPGSVHIVVVDPGVGTTRRPLAAQIGRQYYVGPDNGFLTSLIEQAENQGQPMRFVHLDRPSYWLADISHVFHGRDIFAPAAAHLAAGTALEDLGTPFADPVRLALPKPERTPWGWRAQIIHVDHFGTLASNLRVEHLGYPEWVRVRLLGAEIEGLVNTFGDRPPGELVALYGSTGSLIVAVVNGSAAQRLQGKPGDTLEVWLD
jgi:S-adenosyl-L-methionine hydrolase (adenosine-forming)